MHREKTALTPIHCLALILLALTAGWNLVSLVTRPAAHWSWLEQLPRVFGVGSVWALVIWKTWERPRAWGKGVGIVMVLMAVAHSFLWYRGLQYFRRIGREIEFVPELLKFLPYEAFFLVTGIVCLVLARQSAPQEVEVAEMGR